MLERVVFRNTYYMYVNGCFMSDVFTSEILGNILTSISNFPMHLEVNTADRKYPYIN